MFYAKPISGATGSYKYHIGECHRIWMEMFRSREEALTHFCSSVGISLVEFKLQSEKTVLFHDGGKLLPTFQQQMERLINEQPRDPSLDFRHELASALLMVLMDFEKFKKDATKIPLEVLAVLGHHKQLQPDWHSFERDKSRKNKPVLNETSIKYIIKVAETYGGSCQFDKPLAVSPLVSQKWPSILLQFLNDRLGKIDLNNIPVAKRRNLRLVYALMRGLLMDCDWLASSKAEKRPPINHHINSKLLRSKIKKKVEQESKIYNDLPFHTACEESDGNILAIAPTGSGKTEAALLWATNKAPTKIIFLMPTMVTSNSLFERMENNYFEKTECGLIHSSADTFFAQQHDKADSDNDKSDFRLALHQYRVFIPPVMVATVDQILSSGFNVGSWCQKEWALVGSRVIFDEIHAYEPYTLGLITAAIEKTILLGGRVCIMSATMPAFLRNHFENVLGVEKPIIAEELLGRKKCYWQYKDSLVSEMTEEILDHIKMGKKVAIVFNTVIAAQKAYDEWEKKLGEDRILCYHSQFIMRDRQDKEALLLDKDESGRPKKYDLVIATQAIEVSLDVSFDIMYSECAPLDSLIQRAGRCNRYNKKGDYYFIVFPASETAKNYVYKDSKGLLEKTADIVRRHQKKLSEAELSNLLEEVYEGYGLESDNLEYQEGYRLYDEIATTTDSNGFIFDLKISEDKVTRKFDKYLKVSIIPQKFYEEVKKRWENEEFSHIRLYEVPISEFRRRKLRAVDNPMQLPIYEVPYTWEAGVLAPEDDFSARSV